MTSTDRAARPDRSWAIVAIVAIIAATSGWTTVAVMAIRDGGAAASAATTDPSTAPVDASPEPAVEAVSHEAVALEALLPTEHDGTVLTAESWNGDTVLADDAWSAAILTFLEGHGKVAADFAIAQAWDPAEALDLVVGAFKVDGVDPMAVTEAMKAAWLANDATFAATEASLAGQSVIKGSYEGDTVTYYWYAANGVVYDIETSDEKLATAVVTGIKEGAPPATAGPSPSTSTSSAAPSAEPSPAP